MFNFAKEGTIYNNVFTFLYLALINFVIYSFSGLFAYWSHLNTSEAQQPIGAQVQATSATVRRTEELRTFSAQSHVKFCVAEGQ